MGADDVGDDDGFDEAGGTSLYGTRTRGVVLVSEA
jgi:hypothetical protein